MNKTTKKRKNVVFCVVFLAPKIARCTVFPNLVCSRMHLAGNKGGGRRLDGVWNFFNRVVDAQGSPKATCKGCAVTLSGIVSRLWAHVDVCGELVAQGLVEPPLSSSPEAESSNGTDSSQSQSATPPDQGRKRKFQTLLVPVVTDRDTKTKLDDAIGKFVISANVPFNVVSDPHFIQMVHMLRPGYKPPSRRYIGGPVLDRLYTYEHAKVKAQLDGAVGTLLLDGWSTSANDPV